MPALTWKRLSRMGRDGFATFILSLVVIMATGGFSLLLCWAIVCRDAIRSASRPVPADVTLVLGARLIDGAPSQDFTSRLRRGAETAGSGPILILGGLGDEHTLSEAAAGRQWLTSQGHDGATILLEEKSQNTLENMRFCREIMTEKAFENAVLVTSAYHIARSSILARGLGIPHQACAAPEPSLLQPASLLRSVFEAKMINWYFVGRAWASVSRNETMLSRIT